MHNLCTSMYSIYVVRTFTYEFVLEMCTTHAYDNWLDFRPLRWALISGQHREGVGRGDGLWLESKS